jgi:transporter family protein
MWVLLGMLSALFLGFYDIAKKKSLTGNAVLTVLFLNTVFCALIFLPFIMAPSGETLQMEPLKAHLLVVLKSFIVLSSWIMGYYALKHLPITLTGPINAFRPVLVLLGALIIFGEKLNGLQWTGVLLSILSLFLLSLSGKKEGINFTSNKWIFILFGAVVMGAVSGLYDKYIIRQLPPIFVQSWFNIYQVAIMGSILLLMKRKTSSKFRWSWWIPLISIFISIADFAYFHSLSSDGALIAVISMIRRGSVIISFTAGALLFKEKNLKAKALDLVLILVGLIFLCRGSVS